jgi:beta-N-acetylhexosaminidase
MQSPVILDIAGTTLNGDDKRRLANPLTGGMILFARNWQSRTQLLELCLAIKAVRADLLICVDHEGGRVQRFRSDGFTHLPPMRRLGDLWMQPDRVAAGDSAMRACNAATACGYVLASELRACGVDLSFTPVLDLDHGTSGVIGDRAFSRDPRIVGMLARALMQGLLQAGMAHCGKHFPGHGFVQADSHTEMPIDERGLKAILVVYPEVDSRAAGFSAKWLGDVLRGMLGFGGAVFSDDLSMAGARLIDGKQVSYAQAAICALQAGCDMILLCNQSVEGAGRKGQAVDELLDGLEVARQNGRWQPSANGDARRLALLPRSPTYAWDDLMVLPEYIQALGLVP